MHKMVLLAVIIAMGMMLYEMAMAKRKRDPSQNVLNHAEKLDKRKIKQQVAPIMMIPFAGDASFNGEPRFWTLDDPDLRVRLKPNRKETDVPLSAEDLKLVEKTREKLADFRYPIPTKAEIFRLPDFYFASTRARAARKPTHKFKHLSRVYSRLFVERQPVHITILGGSNTAGSGLGKSMQDVRASYNQSYAVRLEKWLNKVYPPRHGSHVVHNFGRGAVGSCYFQLLVEKLADPAYLGAPTDLFILETSVNDVLSNDMLCFRQLISKINSAFPNASIVSLHLTSGSDFLKSCNIEPMSLTYCLDDLDLEGSNVTLAWNHKSHMEKWCQKRHIVEEFGILQVDLEMLLYMVCHGIPPFQHAYYTSEMMLYARHTTHFPRSKRAKSRLLHYIARIDSKQLAKEAPLLTLGSYNNSKVHDSSVLESYKLLFEDIDAALAAKIGPFVAESGVLGDLILFTPDRVHLGRWGHLLIAAELAIWLTWLETAGYGGIEKALKPEKSSGHQTIWAATTFDSGYYNKRSRNRETNKHKPADPKAKLDIFPLKPVTRAQGWRLYDDSGMQKQGWITSDLISRNISFKLPALEGSPKDRYIIRLGYMKSYVGQMANFSVDVHETGTRRHIKTNWTGYHEDRVSVFVDDIVAIVSGRNRIVLTVTSLPKGPAVKVKIIAVYVTRAATSRP